MFGSGFSSFSNTVGSIYAVTQSSTGGKDTRDNKKAESLKDGLIKGAAGMGTELRTGAKELWNKPGEEAKEAHNKGGYRIKGYFRGSA